MDNSSASLAPRIDAWVTANRERVIALLRDLVRIPSENHPPGGAERAAQEFLCAELRRQGVAAELYAIDAVPGLDAHPLRNPAVDCAGRPNVVVRRPGRDPQRARSLLLSGHMDVVPAGNVADWSRDPFGGQIEGARLFGRGAYDMKGGIAVNAAVMLMFAELDVPLPGDLIMESVVDEEFAGGHGTIAARLAGHQADAVLVPEPSNVQLYRAHRGLRVVRLTAFGKGGLTFAGDRPESAAHHLPALITGIIEFAETRNRGLAVPECYRHDPSPANWMITKVRANEWADDALLAVPETAEIELFWESLPGESQAAVEGEFEAWLEAFRARTGIRVEHRYVLRWMEGFETPAEHPFTRTAEAQTAQVLGRETRAIGAPFPCDLFLFAKFGIDAGLIMGPSGNGAHAADEWVDLDSVLELVRIYGRIAGDWCSQPRA